MPVEIDDDIKFETLLADKRHKELRGALNIIAQALANRNDEAVIEAIEKNADAIKDFADAIKKIPAPEVKVEASNFNSLEKIGNDILKGQGEIVAELKMKHEWSFSFHREHGYISSPIIAKQIK